MTEFIPPKPGQPVEQSSLISMDEDEMDQEDATSPEDQGQFFTRKAPFTTIVSLAVSVD